MSKIAYSDKQIEVANLLRSVGKEGVPDNVVAEIVQMIETKKTEAPKPTGEIQTETMLRMKILEETDWKKKASLCALLISRSFDI